MSEVNANTIPLGLTFDDVLLCPQYSTLRSRSEANISSRISRNITLRTPLVSSNMIDITEEAMAITMARLGGIGILHRFCSAAQQCAMVSRVKRAQTDYISDPRTAGPLATRRELMSGIRWDGRHGGVSSLMIVDENRKLLGVVSRGDLSMVPESSTGTAQDFMVPASRLIMTQKILSPIEAAKLMLAERVSDLPIVDADGKLVGLMTRGDVQKHLQQRGTATLDKHSRLRVGAAVGVKLPQDLERAEQLVAAGADLLVIDIAHGDSELAVEMLKTLKSNPKTNTVDIVAGNIATGEAAQRLIDAGADGLKVGIGAGSICITRIVAGTGIPQLTAIQLVAAVARKAGVPIISDGGARAAGDIVKAIAVGADTVMCGSAFAGTDETPGRVMNRADGQKRKMVRGMAGVSANAEKARREGKSDDTVYDNLVPEGVEGTVPYRGPVAAILRGMTGGLRSGMSYSNSRTLDELRARKKLVRMTANGLRESGAHDISKL